MIYLFLSLYLNIVPPHEIQNRSGNLPKISESYYNVTNTVYKDKQYTDNFIISQADDPLISFRECSFSSIVPTSYFSDSSLIRCLNSEFHLNENNFTSCSFSTALLYIEGSNFSMKNNQIASCYNFDQAVSISNIIRCLRTITNIQLNTISFDDTSHSCRGLYFAECNDTIIKNLTISNSNILRNHGNAIYFSMTNEPKIRTIIENSNFIDCGESDYVIYCGLNVITINHTNITFSKENDQKIGGIYFPNIANFTILKSNFLNIPGTAVIFSDEERTIKPHSIRLSLSNFEGCKNCIFCKLRGDQLSFNNFTFQELEFDSTLITFEGNTEIINFNSIVIQSCPKNKKNENFILEIPRNNREFNFNTCTISSSHFSCSQSCIYFGRTGRFTFRKTNLISLSVAGIVFSDDKNDEGENNSPLEIELLDDTSFPMCGCCVLFNITKSSSISNCKFDNLIFQSDLITFNKTLNFIHIESSNFSKCYSSYQGTSIIELPSNDELEFVMESCIFNYTHLLSGTAIEILNRIHSVTFSDTKFIDIEGDIFIDIDKYSQPENPGELRIVDCSFTNSKSSYDGAAIRINSLCPKRAFEITGCFFNNCNSKKSQGGAISFNAINGRITRCTFIDNVALKGADIYYNVEKNMDKYVDLKNQLFVVEGNIFIRQKDNDNDLSLCFFNVDNATNYHFHHNKFFINESLSHVYLFGCDESSKNVKPTILIENNCMVENNKEKIKHYNMKYEVSYDSAFQWICIDVMNYSLISCPEMPDDSSEIYNGADVEGEENRNFYSCSQIFNTQLIVTNSILSIHYCSFTSIKVGDAVGGAICITLNKSKSNKPVEIHNCSFKSCESKNGGAIFFHSTDLSSKFDLNGCNFTDNKAIIINSKNGNNDGDGNGAALFLNLVFITVKNCIFSENKAAQNGGAVFYSYKNELISQQSDEFSDVYAISLSNCKFLTNWAENRGGAIFLSVKSEISKGKISIDNCQFNMCEASESGGGGLFAAIEKDVYDQILVQSCSFKNCKASFAGGLYFFSSIERNEILIKSCSFVANEVTATSISPYEGQIGGSAVFLAVKNGTVEDCTFLNSKGKKGPIKVTDPSNIDLRSRTLSDDKDEVDFVLIKNCHFDKTVETAVKKIRNDNNGKIMSFIVLLIFAAAIVAVFAAFLLLLFKIKQN